MQNNQKVLMLGGGTSNSMLLRLMASSTLVPVDDVLTLSDFAVNDVEAALALSFTTNEYRTANTSTTFADAFTGNSPKLTYDPGSASSSQSTMVNSSGNIVWAPHNLLTYSEDFTNGWSSFGTTEQLITDNTSPVGNDQVSEVTFTAGTFRQIRQSPVTSNGDQITFRVWAKAGTLDYVAFAPQNVSALSSHRVIVDLSDGSFVQEPTTPVSCSVVDAGSDWYLITASGVVSNSAGHISIQPSDASGNNIDAAGTVLLTGAHVYRSDLGGMAPVPGAATGFETYVPTNGAAEYLPRVGHHIYNGSTWVNEGLLIESEPRTNLIQHSEDFSQWSSTTLEPLQTGFTSPDGASNGTKIIPTTASTAHYVSSGGVTVTNGATYTFSFFAKKPDTDGYRYANTWASAWTDKTGQGPIFDLQTGLVENANGLECNMEDYGQGWYRCVVTGSVNNTSLDPRIYPANASTALPYAGDGTSGIIIYGAQLEQGATPSSYIPTNNSTVIRGGQSLTVPANWYDVDNPTPTGPELWTTPTITDDDVWQWDGSTLTGTGDGTSDSARGDVVTAGGVYRITYNVTRTSGLCQIRIGNTFIETVGATGLREWIIVAGETAGLTVTDSGSFVGSFDNISVRQVSAPQFGWPEPEYIGPELVVDGSGNWVGDFDAAADVSEWTGRNANTQLSLDANRLRVEAGAADTAYAYKRPTADANKVYRVTLDYENVQGVVRVYAGIGPGTNTYYDSGNLTGSGSLDFVFVPTSADPYLSVYASVSNTLGDASLFDNISVRQVSAPQFGWPEPEYIGPELVTDFSTYADQAAFDVDWTRGAGWTFGGGVATHTGVTAGNLRQTPFTIGKTYQVSWDQSGGKYNAVYGDTLVTLLSNVNIDGTHTAFFTPSTSNRLDFRSSGDGAVLDNVSVREINPLSVSIQMDGRMTYADTDVVTEAVPWDWAAGGTDRIFTRLNTAGGTGKMSWVQGAAYEETGGSQFSPGINVPFNIASRHGSTFIDAAVDGVALTGGTTPTALPDLSSTDLQIAYDFMGTIGQFRQFAGDIGETGIVTATNPSTEPTLSLTFDGTASGSFYNLSWSE